MKKILFLLILCIIKLNAYEYLFFDNYNDSTGYSAKYRWFTDSSGKLKVKEQLMSGFEIITTLRYDYLSYIKIGDVHYIDSLEFKDIYSSNLNFLDDLYTQYTNVFLNYLYTQGRFSDHNYIQYENYELLYNEDGLAVESIVDGVWAGLYADSQKDKSGYLVNQDGVLYKDGEQANYFQELTYYLVMPVKNTFLQADKFATGKACLLFLVTVFTFMIYFWIINHVVRGLNYYKEIRDKK